MFCVSSVNPACPLPVPWVADLTHNVLWAAYLPSWDLGLFSPDFLLPGPTTSPETPWPQASLRHKPFCYWLQIIKLRKFKIPVVKTKQFVALDILTKFSLFRILSINERKRLYEVLLTKAWPLKLILDLMPTLSPTSCMSRSKLFESGHGTTDWFQIGKGVHQGCILSPCLFNLYAEYIMRNAGLDEAQAGNQRLPREASITSDMQMTPPLWQKVKNN